MFDEEEYSKSLQDYLNILKRRKLSMIIPTVIVFLMALMLALGLPATYRSEATILIEEQEVPKDFVRTTITSYAAQQVQVISQRILTVENIKGIADKFNLYQQTAQGSRIPSTEIAEAFRESMKLDLVSADVVDPRSGRPTEATIAFTLAFEDGNPTAAQKITNELVTLFLDENLRNRTEQATSTVNFLAAESQQLDAELKALEVKLAAFKTDNKGSLPELHQFNLSTLERSQREVSDITFRLQVLEKRKIELSSELAQISPSAPVVMATGEVVLPDRDRLRALQSALRQKSTVYSDQHPELIRLKREIKSLTAELSTGMQQSGQTAQADNPAYVLLDTQLKAVSAEMRSLMGKRVELNAKIDKYEQLLLKAPDVEKDYQSLIREYQTAQAKYQEITSKRREADLAKDLEQEQRGERFTLIQPALLPLTPSSPNRLAIILAGFILSGAAGFGVVMLRESLDTAIHGEAELTAVMGASPLVVIPYIDNQADINKRKRYWLLGIVSTFILVVLLLVYIHFFFKPLDVLWFVILKKVGLS